MYGNQLTQGGLGITAFGVKTGGRTSRTFGQGPDRPVTNS